MSLKDEALESLVDRHGATGHDEIKEMVAEMAELFFPSEQETKAGSLKQRPGRVFLLVCSASSRSDQDFFTPNLWVCHPCLCSN